MAGNGTASGTSSISREATMNNNHNNDDGDDTGSGGQGREKRRRITQSCNMCRKKRIKCDGKVGGHIYPFDWHSRHILNDIYRNQDADHAFQKTSSVHGLKQKSAVLSQVEMFRRECRDWKLTSPIYSI